MSSISLFAQEEKRLALVIGNANYEKGELKNPVNDARLIASTLDSLDFDVILKENLESQTDFKRAILEFGKKRPEYDIAFVYYAGHGVQISGENYLLPTKVEFSGEDEVEMFGVSVQDIMRYLKSQTNEVNILILDACRDNPFESNWNTTRSLKGGGLAKIPPPTGSLIAFSTDSGQTAPDGDGENSIYSTSLAKNMLLEDTSIDQVFRNVRAEVLAETKGAQRPVEATQLTGQTFYLNLENYTKAIIKAKDFIKNKKFLNAILILDTSLAKNTNNTEMLELKLQCYYGLEKFDEGLELINYMSSLDENNSENFANKAKLYEKLGKLEKAEYFWMKASELNKKHILEYSLSVWNNTKNYNASLEIIEKNTNENKKANYYYIKALIQKQYYDLKGDLNILDEAIVNFKLIEKQANFEDFIKINLRKYVSKFAYSLADSKRNVPVTNKIDEAIELIDRLRKFENKDGELVIYKAQIYSWYSQQEKAIIELNKYLKFLKDNPDFFQLSKRKNYFHWAYYMLGINNRGVGNYDKAIKHLSDAIKLDPTNHKYHFERALCYSDNKNYNQAISDYLKALELDSENDVKTYYNIAVNYGYINNYEEALKFLNKGLNFYPNDDLMYYKRSTIHEKLKNYDKVMEDITTAINLNPEVASYYQWRGDQYNLKFSDYENAKLDYNQAINLGSYNALVQTVFMYFSSDVDEAKLSLDLLNEKYPDTWFGNYLYFIYYTQPNYDYDKALNFYKKITTEQQMPDWFKELGGNALVYWVNSILQYRAGKFQESERFIRMAIDSDDKKVELHYILFRIKEKENKFLALEELSIAIQKMETLPYDDGTIVQIEKYEEVFLGALYKFRAELYLKLGEYKLACSDFEKFQVFYNRVINSINNKNLIDSADKILIEIKTLIQENCSNVE